MVEQQPQEELDKEAKKKKVAQQMAKKTTANAPVPPEPEQPEPDHTEGEQPEPELSPAELKAAEQAKLEKQQREQQIQEALTYFGPRLAAQVLGGNDAANITDRLLKDYQNQVNNIEDRKAEQQRLADRDKRDEEEFNLREQAEKRKQKEADERSKQREQQATLGQGNLFARLEEIKVAKQRAGDRVEENRLKRKEINLKRSLKQIENFGKLPTIKKLQGQQTNLDDMKNILESAPEIAAGVIPFKIAKGIAGEVGNLNMQELRSAQVSPSFARNIKRVTTKFLTGKIPQEDKEELLKIVKFMKKKQTSNMKKLADNYVKSRRRYVDPNELRQDLYSQYGLEDIKLSGNKKKISDYTDEELYNMSDEELSALERQAGIK